MTLDAMKAKIAELTDDQIREGTTILAESTGRAERTTRAYLIAEWEHRHGPEAADRLMDDIGL